MSLEDDGRRQIEMQQAAEAERQDKAAAHLAQMQAEVSQLLVLARQYNAPATPLYEPFKSFRGKRRDSAGHTYPYEWFQHRRFAAGWSVIARDTGDFGHEHPGTFLTTDGRLYWYVTCHTEAGSFCSIGHSLAGVFRTPRPANTVAEFSHDSLVAVATYIMSRTEAPSCKFPKVVNAI